MKLKLKEPWCLRGYRGDLFVLEKSGSIEIPYRLKYPLYELLSKCDGVTEIDKEYEESQEQRRLERQLRYEKRDLAVLKAQGASDEEIRAQRLRVKNASTNLNDFCEETGRARRTNRERTPIKADFPEV